MTDKRSTMKIVVIGGSGLIGSKVVKKLAEQGHQAVAASPSSGVNTLTGEGLAEVLDGASGILDPLLDRSRDAVLRVRQEHDRRRDRRQHGSSADRAYSTHGGRRCCQCGVQRGDRKAGEWYRRGGWARTVPFR